jgi:hypothetical protein
LPAIEPLIYETFQVIFANYSHLDKLLFLNWFSTLSKYFLIARYSRKLFLPFCMSKWLCTSGQL